MALSTPPDTLIFKTLVHEIQEVDKYFSAIDILEFMCAESKYLAEHCEYYFFIADEDGKIDESEAYLLEWLKTMEAQKADELRFKLRDVAFELSKNSGYY